jgi:transposase
MVKGGTVKQIYELHGRGLSIRRIAEELGLARNTVRKYLREPGIPTMRPRPARPSKLEPHRAFLEERLGAGVTNTSVLLRELRARGYAGGVTILKEYVQPHRRPRQPVATVRFETPPGEQAQVDWGYFRYRTAEGGERSLWAFVLVLAWSRALYVELVPRADVATFIRCHLNAFEHLGGVPRRCLYDNAKVVVLGRDAAGEPTWNERFLDFALRVGFELRLCRPYRAQTKGRVESGVKYVRGNFWPTARFADLADLNRQARAWVDGVAAARVHGTTLERPADRLVRERPHLLPLPPAERVAPFRREERRVGRDGFVAWERSWYGVSWSHAGRTVQVQAEAETIAIWAGNERLAVHPRATRPGQRLTTPGQWAGLAATSDRPAREPLAVEVPSIEVERRSLAVYDALIGSGSGR